MNLQVAIDHAGSPVDLLWKPQAAPWSPPVVQSEYAGWEREQAASTESVALSDLSHHMSDLFIDGPDAVTLLSEHSANDYQRFAIGQAKQFVAVTPRGHMVSDGILIRDDERRFTLSGPPAAQNWVQYHAEHRGYAVTLSSDPDSAHRGGADPKLFRFQIQGPQAPALCEKVFGGPLPPIKFFHSTPVTLGGRHFRALRHGMTGQAGYEFVGAFSDGAYVMAALIAGGEEFGLVQVGGLAYSTNGIESGWIPTQTPGIYTDPALRAYREYLPSNSYEGHKPLNGSLFCEDIEAYYVTPYEIGCERSINFDHDFVGRDALRDAAEQPHRQKVTLMLDAHDVARALGHPAGFLVTYARHRVESGADLVGMTCQIGSIAPVGALLGLALVDPTHATLGTELTVVWGEHPGPGIDADADLGFVRIRATVHPSPFNEFTRSRYREDPPAAR